MHMKANIAITKELPKYIIKNRPLQEVGDVGPICRIECGVGSAF